MKMKMNMKKNNSFNSMAVNMPELNEFMSTDILYT